MTSSYNQKQEVGLRIKEARSALGWTQKQLCEQAGMKLPSLRDYELGNSIPGGEAVTALMTAGINANWLLTGEGPMLIDDMCPPTPLLAGKGEMLLADCRARTEVERKESFGDAFVQMAIVTTPDGANSTGQEINEPLLNACYRACRDLYKEGFDALPPQVQMGYASDLYTLLARLCISNGKDLAEVMVLEGPKLVDLLSIYNKLGWSRKFPPPPMADGCFF